MPEVSAGSGAAGPKLRRNVSLRARQDVQRRSKWRAAASTRAAGKSAHTFPAVPPAATDRVRSGLPGLWRWRTANTSSMTPPGDQLARAIRPPGRHTRTSSRAVAPASRANMAP
ncbi:hypothetical protein ABMX48_14360 [Streptomyces cavourensis]